MPDAGIIICGAVPILLIATGMWGYNVFLLLRYKRASGTVLGYDKLRGGKGSGSEAEIVEFELPNGEKVTFTDKTYLNRLILWGGQTVQVLYDPDQPTRARVNKFSTLYLFPTILTGVGVGMILAELPMFHGPMQMLIELLEKMLDKLPWWL